MKNKLSTGSRLTLIAPAAVYSGVPAVVGSVFVVPFADAAVGEEFAADWKGEFEFTKDDSAPDQLAIAYWDGTDVTSDPGAEGSENRKIGVFTMAAAANDTHASVLLTGEIE